jgi:hypothetical protein
MAADRVMLLGEAADRLGVQSWRLARLFRQGHHPEPPRLGRYRVVRESELPALRAALLKAGWLKPRVGAA